MSQVFKNKTGQSRTIYRIGNLEPLHAEPFGEVKVDLKQVYKHELKRIGKFFVAVSSVKKTEAEETSSKAPEIKEPKRVEPDKSRSEAKKIKIQKEAKEAKEEPKKETGGK